MKAVSCFSTNMDPYRAGIELANKLSAIQPEIVFLFPSIRYNGSPEMLEAIFDVLDPKNTVLIGNTVDGFYEKNKVASVGVSALGLNSGGTIKWHLKYQSGMEKTPFASTANCITELNKILGQEPPALYFLASDFRTDTDEIVAALKEKVNAPVVGGLAGDDYAFEKCFIYANNEVLTDSIAILAIEGNLLFSIGIANTLQPMGQPGIITDCIGTQVQSIDNIPAMNFIERELGKPLEFIDQGRIVFKVIEEEIPGEHRITGLLLPDDKMLDSSIKLFGKIDKGKQVQVCLAPPAKIMQDVKDIANSLGDLPFKPVAALIISCAGRKKILTNDIGYEVKEIVHSFPSLEALVGFPSFGELGPLKTNTGYSQPLFHNMTFILVLIGE